MKYLLFGLIALSLTGCITEWHKYETPCLRIDESTKSVSISMNKVKIESRKEVICDQFKWWVNDNPSKDGKPAFIEFVKVQVKPELRLLFWKRIGNGEDNFTMIYW